MFIREKASENCVCESEAIFFPVRWVNRRKYRPLSPHMHYSVSHYFFTNLLVSYCEVQWIPDLVSFVNE